MSTLDISREATDFKKHYAGVRMQQGRVLTDDDFNEAAILSAEEMRRTRLHAIGAFGSPDEGFLPVATLSGEDKIALTLNAGTLYLGGLKLELDAPEGFQSQKDWLTFEASKDWPSPPGSGHSRVDLVWIEAWQQPVCAAEDRELFEVALGGPDTSGRMRTMRRVHVMTNVGHTACERAWSAACEAWAGEGAINAEMELEGSARITVSYTDPSASGSLCTPATSGDYLGYENQAIRVQAIDATHFTWGFDNASPLYRAQVQQESPGVLSVHMLTQPKDAVHWPLKGQVVELLPCGAVLPNGEKLAEHSGFLTRVASSYDPDTQSFTIAADAAAPKGDLVFVRIWNRGEDLSSSPALPLSQGTLGSTGLAVTFKGGAPRPGDYWIIAARPSAPEVVTPWCLQNAAGAPPRGIKRYRAPLGLIRWSPDGVTVYDCRPSFKPLTSLRCCGELVAKPGPGWFLIFDLIGEKQDASICFPPGDYPISGIVHVEGKGRLRLRGAGPASRILGGNESAIRFQDCDAVDMSDLYVFGGSLLQPYLNGAINLLNVPQVTMRRMFVRCKGASHRERSCVNIHHVGAVKTTRASITDSEFYVGHLQIGLLLTNVSQIDVRHNRFLPSGTDVSKLQSLLKDDVFRTNLAQSALVWIPSDETTVPSNQELYIPVRGKAKIRFATNPSLINFWRAYVKEHPVNYAADQGGFLRIHLMRRLERMLGWSWDRLEKTGLRNWLNAIVSGNQTTIGQAIVVGGVKAENVLIESNLIRGALQGVHVGLSHQTAQRNLATADVAVRVVVRQNSIYTVLCPGAPRERHGIFVGNVDSATICENHLTLGRQSSVTQLPVDGIRVFGFLGSMVQIVGNDVHGFSTPINVAEVGATPEQALRVTRDNYPS